MSVDFSKFSFNTMPSMPVSEVVHPFGFPYRNFVYVSPGCCACCMSHILMVLFAAYI
jgi:hypothetical protein